MGTYETLLFALVSLTVFLFGVWLGRRMERYEIYLKLLASRDPQAWTVAHLLRKGRTLADPPENVEDRYHPTALVPHRPVHGAKVKTTVKVNKDKTSKPDTWKP